VANWAIQSSEEVLPDNAEMEEMSYEDCRRVVTLIYVIMSMMLPLFVIWMLEISSRLEFIRSMRHSSDEQFRGIRVDSSWVPDIMQALVLSLTSILTLLAFF